MKMNQEQLEDLFSKATELADLSDFKGAFDLYMEGASLGDDMAQHSAGLAYDFGEGVEQNKETALYWYKKAWKTSKGSHYINAIALTYVEIGKTRNAIYWWEKAVQLNDGSAAVTFAKFLLESNRRDKVQDAIELLKMALLCKPQFDISEAEHEEAQEMLEVLTSEKITS